MPLPMWLRGRSVIERDECRWGIDSFAFGFATSAFIKLAFSDVLCLAPKSLLAERSAAAHPERFEKTHTGFAGSPNFVR